jgi:hypothetical protein
MIPFLAFSFSMETSLSTIGTQHWQSGFDRACVNRSVGRTPLVVGGKVYSEGIGTHAAGGASFSLDGKVTSISGAVAINDTGTGGSVDFSIWGDGKLLWQSEIVRAKVEPVPFNVKLTGVKKLVLINSDGGDGEGEDHANWLGVKFLHAGAKPTAVAFARPLTLFPDKTLQTMSNFGASDSWTVEPLIHWSEAKRNEVARLLFDKKPVQDSAAGDTTSAEV